MFNVLTVEDEILERENIRASWIWKTGNFKLCADAANGEDAWQILLEQPIDIVVTDIRMPFMDGLELCRLISQHKPNIKVIILSGYSDFSYAQKALSLGVSDYILKPVKSADLLDALNKVAAQINQENEKQAELNLYKQQIHQNIDLQQQKFYLDLATGAIPCEIFQQRATDLGISLDFQQVCCAIIELIEESRQIGDQEYLLILDAQDMIKSELAGDSTLFFVASLRNICLIFQNTDTSQIKAKISMLLSRIKEMYLNASLKLMPCIAVGRMRQGPCGITESFADAQFILNFKFWFSPAEIMYFDETTISDNQNMVIEMTLMKEKTQINNLLRSGSKDDIQPVVDSLVCKLQSLSLSYMLFQYTCLEIINQIKLFQQEIFDEKTNRCIAGASIKEDLFQLDNWLHWTKDPAAFSQNLKRLLNSIIDQRDKMKNYRYSTIIAIAQEFISQNYANSDLSLSDVANHIKITPSYFSSVFSQETGESFIEHLTKIRISKAREMLNITNTRIVDIAFMVGYQDSNYFSKIYRKITGETPSQTRNRL